MIESISTFLCVILTLFNIFVFYVNWRFLHTVERLSTSMIESNNSYLKSVDEQITKMSSDILTHKLRMSEVMDTLSHLKFNSDGTEQIEKP